MLLVVGSGTLDFNDLKLEKYFTEKLIEKSSKLQLSLLKKAVNIIKTGEEIVYSTCSILQDENEDILEEVLKSKNLRIVPIEFENNSEIPLLPTKIDGTIGVFPNQIFEGFFVAKIQKI